MRIGGGVAFCGGPLCPDIRNERRKDRQEKCITAVEIPYLPLDEIRFSVYDKQAGRNWRARKSSGCRRTAAAENGVPEYGTK